MHKTGCAREIENKLSFHSLAPSFNKTGCAREIENRFSFRSLAPSFNKTGCAREIENEFSLRPIAPSFNKTGCAREIENRFSFRSLAPSLLHIEERSVRTATCVRSAAVNLPFLQNKTLKGSETALFYIGKLPCTYTEICIKLMVMPAKPKPEHSRQGVIRHKRHNNSNNNKNLIR